MDTTRVRILHLDDNPSDAKLIKALIEQTDHGFSASVESVETKEAYLAALRSCAFDLILSDHHMPGYDGDDALKDARALCPDVPFIMVTGELGEERAVETLKAGATDYVLKDRIRRLVPSIRRALKDAAFLKDSLANERKYRTIVETAAEGIALTRPDGPYTFVNQRMAEMLGYSVEEILGKVSLDFCWDERKGQVVAARAELHRGDFINGEFKFRRKDGTALWTMYNASAIFDAQGKHVANLTMHTDITERKQTENQLQYLAKLVETVSDAIISTDKELMIRSWNKAAERLYGWCAEEVIGLKGSDILQTSFPEGLTREAITKAIFDQGSWAGELIQKTKTGEIITVQARSVALKDETGNVIGGVSISQDVTERKRLEEAVAAAQRQIQSIVNNTPAMVYASDLEQRFVMTNTALAELLNSTPEQMIGKRRHEFMPREDADWHEANDRKVIETGKALEFEESSQLDGRSISWLTMKFPLRDAQGKIYAVGGISTDVSVRKQVEEALRRSEEKYRQIVETTQEGIWTVDAERRTLFVNERMAAMLGYTVQEMMEKPWTEFVPQQQHRQGSDAGVQERKEGVHRSPEGYEMEFRRKDGSTLWASVNSTPLFNDQGAYTGSISMLTDITERKRAEDELRERERLQGVLARIGELATQSTGSAKLVEAIGRSVAETLGVSRCGYMRINLTAGQLTILHDYHGDDLPSIAGTFSMKGNADYYIEDRQAGRTACFEDTATHPRTAPEYESVYAPIQVRAHIAVPLRRGGQWVADFWVSHHEPRPWSPSDIRLVQAVAERAWTVIERIEAEEALAVSESQQRELLETANSFIIRWDKDGIIRFVNDYTLRFFGYTREELVGGDVMRLAPKVEESTGRSLEGLVEDILRHPDQYRDHANENLRKDGTTVWVAWTNKVILDEHGEAREVLAIGNDVTPLKEAERALKASEENLRLMVDAAPEAIAVLTKSGVIEAISPMGSKLLGYDSGELVGKDVGQFAKTFSRLELALKLEDLRKQNSRPLATTMRVRTKAGVQLMNLVVTVISPGTEVEKFMVKFSRFDIPPAGNYTPIHNEPSGF